MVEKPTVEKWLHEMGLEAEPSGLQNEDDFLWTLSYQGEAFRTLVAHVPIDANHLIMQIEIGVSDSHKQMLRGLDDDTRDRFMYDLRIAFLQQPVGYSLVTDEDGILDRFVFGYNLMEDPLQRAGFFRRNHQLQSAALLATQMIQKFDRFGAS